MAWSAMKGAGNPLAIRQADGSRSTDELRFQRYDVAPAVMGDRFSVALGSTILDFSVDSNQATVLIELESFEESPLGQTFYIALTDLMQFAELEPTSIGMEPRELHNLISHYGTASAGGFEAVGAKFDSTGETERYYYNLTVDGSAQGPLCAAAP